MHICGFLESGFLQPGSVDKMIPFALQILELTGDLYASEVGFPAQSLTLRLKGIVYQF